MASDDKITIRRTKGSVVRPRTKNALGKLGSDIEFARRVRGLTMEDLAERAGISRATLHRLESGDGAGISLNSLAMVLTALGQLELLTDLIDMRNDEIGLAALRDSVMKRNTPGRLAARGEKIKSLGSAAKAAMKVRIDPSKLKASAGTAISSVTLTPQKTKETQDPASRPLSFLLANKKSDLKPTEW